MQSISIHSIDHLIKNVSLLTLHRISEAKNGYETKYQEKKKRKYQQ